MSVIVTHARNITALTIVRSLGRKGINVTTADNIPFATSSYSRYSKRHFIYPSSKLQPNAFINELIKRVRQFKPEVLMPVYVETYPVIKYKKKLEKFTKVPFHDYNHVIRVHNKLKLMKIAEELGITIPKTYEIKDIIQLKKIANKIEYPAVVKMQVGLGSKGIKYVNNALELIKGYNETICEFNISKKNYPIVQEYVKGTGAGCSCLYNQGNLRAFFCHKRIREFPITGGPSTSRVGIRHHKMEKFTFKLLEEMDWHGIAMVEYKINENNEPVLMEVNPRFWGSLDNAVESGVDFPYLLYRMALDGDVKPILNYKTGIISRWALGEIRCFFDYLLSGRKNKLKGFFNFWNCTWTDLSMTDPLPALAQLIYPVFQFIKTGKFTGEMYEERTKMV